MIGLDVDAVEGVVKISQLGWEGGVLLCRSEKQVLVATRREAVLERIRSKRSVPEVLLLLCSFQFPRQLCK